MSQILLLPIDGTETALRAVDWLITHHGDWKEPPVVHVLNVQPSLHGDVGRFVSSQQLQDFHREAGDQALAEATRRLGNAGIGFHAHVRVGESSEVICQAATELAATQLILGTRGHSGLTGLLLGSVATRLAHQSSVPVTLVR